MHVNSKIKVFLIGGTRYIGFRCAWILFEMGYEVITMSRTPINKSKWKHIICDRKNHTDLLCTIYQEKPNLILDMVCFDQDDASGIIDLYQSGQLSSVTHYVMVSTFFVYNYCDYREVAYDGYIESISDVYTKRKVQAESIFYNNQFFNIISIAKVLKMQENYKQLTFINLMRYRFINKTIELVCFVI
jgi:nucleoside-diphosphate-sugar epimerase